MSAGKDNIIVSKSYSFALQIVEIYKYLVTVQKEYVLSKQLLRAGTSVGANIHEGMASESKKDFIAPRFWSRLSYIVLCPAPSITTNLELGTRD